MTLADILVVMNGGQVEQIGNPLDIYQKPATTFVASFIGAPPMNLMPLRSDELKSQLAGDSRPARPASSESGPRILSSRARTCAGGVALDLTVEAIERVGAETFVYGTRQQEVQGVAANPGELPPGEVIVRIPGAVGPAIGERIRAVAPRDKLHLFSADGRKRIDSCKPGRFGAENRFRGGDLGSFQRCLNAPQITPILAIDRTARPPAGRMGCRKGPSKSLREDFVMSRVPSLSSPFLLGFDEIERALDRVVKGADGYPPYNIERCDRANGQPERLRITLAVAGFTRDQLDVTIEENQLVIRGRQQDDKARQYIHRGIAARHFQRTFVLAEGMQVLGADLKNGLLSIDLARPEPERVVKTIAINEHE